MDLLNHEIINCTFPCFYTTPPELTLSKKFEKKEAPHIVRRFYHKSARAVASRLTAAHQHRV